MSNSMVSTVLQIEREAEALLEKARGQVETILADAKTQRDSAATSHAEELRQEIADLETRAAAERAKKIAEAEVAGETALARVTSVSEAVFDNGVQHLLKALAGK